MDCLCLGIIFLLDGWQNTCNTQPLDILEGNLMGEASLPIV